MTFGRTLSAAAALALAAGMAQSADLRIGLQDDPDVLDPDQSRTFVGRIVFAAMCDKLVDITPDLEIIPQLATSWSWSNEGKTLTMELRDGVTFHDGAAFDAAAVVANITRSKTLDESRRKSQVKSIESVEAIGDLTVQFNLANPDATLMAQFADRAGMMISPAAAEAAGAEFGLKPVCSGPMKFKDRVQQDRIVLEKYDGYWNADAISFDTVTYLPISDTTVRLANLRAGDLDMIERLAATDLASAEGDADLKVERATSLGYQGVTFNVGNGAGGENPFAQDAKLREAFNLAIDRNVINQVVFEGAFAPGNQHVPPTSPWYNADLPVPVRDVAKAKALLAEAGYGDGIDLEVQLINGPVQQQLMQVVQAMAAEAGIRISLVAKEFGTLLSDQDAGKFQGSQIGWSGRVDPDGNIHGFVTTGAGFNDAGYSNAEVDKLLDMARTSSDLETRKLSYDKATAILAAERPIVYLYHPVWIWALDSDVKGYVPYPDGMIRLEGMSKL